jgi:cell division initiation protein
MKITPIEIRQKAFSRVLRGYDKEEVDAFLQTLSQEWERVMDENKEYRIKLDMSEREVRKLREVEGSLYKTLKAAEETGSHLIEQANRSAELYLREAKAHADSLLREARAKAQQMLQETEVRSRRALEETLGELKSLEKDFRQLENQKENFVLEVRSMASDTLEKVNRVAARGNSFSFDDKINEVKEMLERKNDLTVPPPAPLHNDAFASSYPAPVRNSQSPASRPAPEAVPQPPAAGVGPKPANGSFFDEIQ